MKVEFTTTCRPDRATGLWLPEKITERIDSQDGLNVEGTMTFSNWRVVLRKVR